MGFGSWNCQNSPSKDPYKIEIDEDDGNLTKQNKKHKSAAKPNKNCNSSVSTEFARYKKENFSKSLLYPSQDSSHINRRKLHKHNHRIQVAEKPYKIFKSRNPCSSLGENLTTFTGINSRCASQENGNTECSSETHYLADRDNGKIKEYFTIQDIETSGLSLTSSYIKQSEVNTNTATQVVVPPKETVPSLSPSLLFHSYIKASLTPLNEDPNLNLKSIRKLYHNQSSQISSQISKVFKPQAKSENLLKKLQHKINLTKPNKFFKSRNNYATDEKYLRYCIENNCSNLCCTYKFRKSFDVENQLPKNYCPATSKSQMIDPYSFESDGDNHLITLNKKFKSLTEPKSLFKHSKIHFSTDVLSSQNAHSCGIYNKDKGMLSVDVAGLGISHSPRKQTFMSSKIKATNQPEQETNLPIVHTTIEEMSQVISESTETLSVPKSLNENIGLNLQSNRKYQVDTENSSLSLSQKGKDEQPCIAVTSSKKCSIGYIYEIKNTLSAATTKRNIVKNINVESIHEKNEDRQEETTVFLKSGNNHSKKKNISNYNICKLAHKSNTKFSPVTRSLAELNIDSKFSKKNQAETIGISEEELLLPKFIPNTSTTCSETTIAKTLCETKEFGTPRTVTEALNMNVLKSSKIEKSPRMSLTKDSTIGMRFCHNKIMPDELLRDELDLESKTDDIKDNFKMATEDLQFNVLLEQKLTALKDYKKNRMENKVKHKDNSSGEDLLKLKPNIFCKYTNTTEKTSGSKGNQTINNVTKKTLPIMKRASSFKKHIFTSNQRKKHSYSYKHKWIDDADCKQDTEVTSPTRLLAEPIGIINSGLDLEELKIPKLVCVVSEYAESNAFTKEVKAMLDPKCNKLDKYHFTMIKNVRKSDQIQELGELQEFNDDVVYILDALLDSNPTAIRCHSALILASKCFMPAFRVHIRTYGAITKFFHALHDAAKDQCLALCTATIMFVLSLYQLHIYLNPNSMQLLLKLLNSCLIHEIQFVQLCSIKKKVIELCSKVQSHGYAQHLHLENITASHLASEVLLILASCETGNIFVDIMRKIRGLEHIIKAINSRRTELDRCITEWEEPVLDKLCFLHCCFQVFEHITDQNEESQLYALNYENGCFMVTVASLFSKCSREIRNAHNDAAILELLLIILKVLINLTHNTSCGSLLVARRPDFIYTSFYVLLQGPTYVPEEKRFDVLALVLTFLINTVEHSAGNRKLIFEAKSSDIMIHNSDKHAVEVLIELFYQQKRLARIEELRTDAMLNDKIDSQLTQEIPESSQEFIATLQENAGQNMEHTIIASYLVLLIGYMIEDNEEYETFVRQCLPQKSFSTMISVLEKMHDFLNLISTISSKQDITQTQHILQYLKQLDEKAIVDT